MTLLGVDVARKFSLPHLPTRKTRDQRQATWEAQHVLEEPVLLKQPEELAELITKISAADAITLSYIIKQLAYETNKLYDRNASSDHVSLPLICQGLKVALVQLVNLKEITNVAQAQEAAIQALGLIFYLST